ncbi:hypothetical protein ABK040_016838 [Willaertia magna]
MFFAHSNKCPLKITGCKSISGQSVTTTTTTELSELSTIDNNNILDYQPPITYASTSELVPNKNLFLSWGGRYISDGEIKIHRFNLDLKQWIYPPFHNKTEENKEIITYNDEGDIPTKTRYYHSLTYCKKNDTLYLIGGITDDDTPIPIMRKFNFTKQQWTLLHFNSDDPNVPDDGICGHIAVYRPKNNTIVLFGGYGKNRFEDEVLYQFDCNTEQWIDTIEPIPEGRLSSRSFSTAIYREKTDEIILYGGETNVERCLVSELAIYSFKENRWTLVHFQEPLNSNNLQPPPPVFGHCFGIVNDRFVLTFGGCDHNERLPKKSGYLFDLIIVDKKYFFFSGQLLGSLKTDDNKIVNNEKSKEMISTSVEVENLGYDDIQSFNEVIVLKFKVLVGNDEESFWKKLKKCLDFNNEKKAFEDVEIIINYI